MLRLCTSFHLIPIKEVDLRHEIHFNEESGEVTRHQSGVRAKRMYSARIGGRDLDMTVACYQGPNVEDRSVSFHLRDVCCLSRIILELVTGNDQVSWIPVSILCAFHQPGEINIDLGLDLQASLRCMVLSTAGDYTRRFFIMVCSFYELPNTFHTRSYTLQASVVGLSRLSDLDSLSPYGLEKSNSFRR